MILCVVLPVQHPHCVLCFPVFTVASRDPGFALRVAGQSVGARSGHSRGVEVVGRLVADPRN